MSDPYITRRGLNPRTGPVADVALGAWDGAATNDPAQMVGGAVHAARGAMPAAAAAEAYSPVANAIGGIPHEIEKIRRGMDYTRMQPWLRENASLLESQRLGFRTRPLTPIPPQVTSAEAVGAIGAGIKQNLPMYRRGLRFWAPQAAKGIAKLASAGAAGYQAIAGGLEGAYKGLNTPTEEYQRRTGIENELLARGAGVMADVGDATTFGLAGKVGRKIADWIP